MSWACSYTGITSIFNDRQRIGISSDCSNPATAIDFVNVAVQSDIRTIFVQPGNEQAVVAAVAKACERKDVRDVDFKYIMALNRNDHMVQNMLEKKISELRVALGDDEGPTATTTLLAGTPDASSASRLSSERTSPNGS